MKSPPPASFFRRLAGMVTLAVTLAAGSFAWAEKADRSKPMNIEADAMRYDNLKQTSVFTGNVVVTKGTIMIRGDRIEVRQDPEGYQYGVVTAAPGKRAYYKQKRDAGPDEWVEGEAETIEYDGRADSVRFVGGAVLRRLLGAVPHDETSGPLIVYDQGRDTFTVNGSAASNAGAPGKQGGRVRAVLTPKPAPAGETHAPPSGTGLRPATTLGGDAAQ
jgi:lipopolysaccharide export system protein LptA